MIVQDKFIMFRNRLEKVFRHRSKIARRQGIDCYRLYDRDLPEFPLIIDVYGSSANVSEYQSRHSLSEDDYDIWLESSLQITAGVLDFPLERVFCKRRQRKADRQSQYQRAASEHQEFEVKEAGLTFIVNLSDYLDTGLFPDHRITRGMVRDLSAGKKVLNLFCYTGAFSVYAAAGGAIETVSVDLSNTYTEWTKRNLLRNGFDLSAHQVVKADVLQFLPECADASYDLIVLDPPSFSNSKMMKEFLDIQRDHVLLVNTCLSKLKPGGWLFFSNNLRHFQLDREAIRSERIEDITRQTTPFDFEGKLFRWCYRIQR
jgi:23S rRNA (cytosine1962-C5)-methyltransferase